MATFHQNKIELTSILFSYFKTYYYAKFPQARAERAY